MRHRNAIVLAIVICLIFSVCSLLTRQQVNYFGFKPSVFTIVEENDTHGGFHGDGLYYLILDCSKKPERAQELINDWKPLPLTQNLQLAMYGGVKDGVHYGYDFAESAHWPTIHNGVYQFVDRHSEAVDKSDDTNLFSRASFNFSIALYDLETNTLYYFEMDT